MIHEVKCIQWDTDNENVDLPTELKVNVPDGITEHDDIIEYISNHITEMTDFCHFGFILTT